jgi:demethylspheroidene O-methyltransferase
MASARQRRSVSEPAQSLRARWQAWRNRLLASEGFQSWASRFPLTRPIARRSARQLFDLVSGFVYSQVLYSCVKLGLINRLASSGPASVAELARECDMHDEAMSTLLRAAASLDLVEDAGGDRYCLGFLGAPLAGNPGLQALILHHEKLYTDLVDPVALLRAGAGEGALASYWAYSKSADPSDLDAARIEEYTELMGASQYLVSSEVLQAYDFSAHRRLLDIGGGNGAFCSAAAARYPEIELGVFDLPAVAETARARFAREGLEHRACAHGGDFLRDPLPQGADVVTLLRVLHDHGDDSVLGLLRSVRAAIVDNGCLLVAEQMSDTGGAEPVGDAYFGFYLLAMGQGRPRKLSELSRLLTEAGFHAPREIKTNLPLQTRLLITRPLIGRAAA